MAELSKGQPLPPLGIIWNSKNRILVAGSPADCFPCAAGLRRTLGRGAVTWERHSDHHYTHRGILETLYGAGGAFGRKTRPSQLRDSASGGWDGAPAGPPQFRRLRQTSTSRILLRDLGPAAGFPENSRHSDLLQGARRRKCFFRSDGAGEAYVYTKAFNHSMH